MGENGYQHAKKRENSLLAAVLRVEIPDVARTARRSGEVGSQRGFGSAGGNPT